MKLKDAIHKVAHSHDRKEIDELLGAMHGALADDYRTDPGKACRKALAMTREVSPCTRRLDVIDALLGNYGREIIRHKDGGVALYYSNAGDTYNTTVIMFAISGAFRVSSWGDIVERSNSYQ